MIKRLVAVAALSVALTSPAYADTVQSSSDITNDYFAGKVSAQEAIQALTKEAEAQGNDAVTKSVALANRGNIYRALGDLDRARKDVNDSISLRPEGYGGYRNLAIIQALDMDMDGAVKSMETALANLGKPDAAMEQTLSVFRDYANSPDANTLHKEFQANLYAAEEKYKGKVIYFHGPLTEISRSRNGNPELTIEASTFKEFDCEIDPEYAKNILHLKVGQVVYLSCDLKEGDKAIVDLNNCTMPFPR